MTDLLWFFWMYSFGGYLLERAFAALTRAERRERKCFLLLPLCPVYGLGMLAVLALPLLDTALSVLMGALVAFVSAKLAKGGVIGQNIVMALYLAAVLWFAFNLNGMIEGLAANAAGVKESLSWAAPMLWMADGILGTGRPWCCSSCAARCPSP